MAYHRFCSHCGQEMKCKEERGTTPGAHNSKLRLTCPDCGKLLATIYDREMDIRPVENATISRG